MTPHPSRIARRILDVARRAPALAFAVVFVCALVVPALSHTPAFARDLARELVRDLALGAPAPGTSSADPHGSWMWPVDGAHIVSRPFELPADDFAAGHRGIDAEAEQGSAVASPAPGVVLFAGNVAGRSVLTVDHGDGIVSSFDPLVPAVAAGTTVGRGTLLGHLEAGDAMHCPDGCIHVGVRLQGAYVDPLPFFSRPERSVLLPLSG